MDNQLENAKDFLIRNDAVIDRLRDVALREFEKGPGGLKLIISELKAVQKMANESELQILCACLSDVSTVLQAWIDDPVFIEQLPSLSQTWADVIYELANYFVFLGEEDENDLRNRVNYRLIQLAKASAALLPPPALAGTAMDDRSWGLFDEAADKTIALPETLSAPPAAPLIPRISAHPAPIETPVENPLASHYLICLLGSQQYALPIHQVREILEERREKALPAQRPGIVGLVTVRGLVCPVVDVSHILHAKEDGARADHKKRCMVVCEVDRRTFCFNVDDVKQVASLAEFEDQITPLSPDSSVQKAISHVSHFQKKSVLFVKMREVIPA